MMSFRRWLLLAALATGGLAQPAAAQDATHALPPPRSISVFVDCPYYCDGDYFHTQIAYVDWVRDRAAADVDVLVSEQSTAAQGVRYTFTFLGAGRFAELVDTLQFTTVAGASDDDTRKAMVHTLEEGLVRYLARTPLGEKIKITVPKMTGGGDQTSPKRDPWHAWVFTTSTNGYVFAEQLTRQTSLYGTVSASRITDDWKLNVSVNENYGESRYTVTDPDTTIVNVQRGFGLSTLVVKSLSDHWSAGLIGSLSSSTYLNLQRNLAVTPAVEYDVMPYRESTRRQLRIQYGIGFDALAYNDTTIFLKTAETLPVHTLSVAYAQQEPWGSVNVGVDGSSFLNDGAKRSANLYGGGSLNLVRGLNLNLNASYSVIHNQIYLLKGTATQAEVLLQQRQLETGYRWNLFFGLSYTFGSLFNNVVNPRFGGSSASVSIFN